MNPKLIRAKNQAINDIIPQICGTLDVSFTNSDVRTIRKMLRILIDSDSVVAYNLARTILSWSEQDD